MMTSADSTAIVAEGRAFMESYVKDLLAGDAKALAARYDTTGAWLVGNGTTEFASLDSIRADYHAVASTPPISFEWRDLSYEPISRDAIVVVGRFTSALPGTPPATLSYVVLLRRQGTGLRIRVEDESMDPRQIPMPAAHPDSVKTGG